MLIDFKNTSTKEVTDAGMRVSNDSSLLPVEAVKAETPRREAAQKVVSFPTLKEISRPVCIPIFDESQANEWNEEEVVNHSAEPIKNIEDIIKIQDYLIGAHRYRDNLLFVCGINFGLRISDLLKIKVGHLISTDGTSYNDKITLIEKKTSKKRVLYVNEAVMDAADLYFKDLISKGKEININDYLFTGLGNRSKNSGKPMDSKSVERILKEVINDKCHIDVHASTHCLRKTFAYQMIMNASDRSRAIEFLQKILGHSSQSITLRYAGITEEEICEAYKNLNLGKMNIDVKDTLHEVPNIIPPKSIAMLG